MNGNGNNQKNNYKYPYQNTVNSLKMSGRRVQNYISTGDYRGLSSEIRNSANILKNSINRPLYNTAPNKYGNMRYIAKEQSTVGLWIGKAISLFLIIFFIFMAFSFLSIGLGGDILYATVLGTIFAVLAGVFTFAFVKSRKAYKISSNYNNYRGAIILSQTEIVNIHRLSLTVKKSDEDTIKDVEIFIKKGLLPEATLSADKKNLLLSQNAKAYYERSEKYRKDYGVHISKMDRDLSALKNLVPSVMDRSMTEKLYHTVSSVEAIISNVKKDNENVKKTLTFESYYLPTTVKLVNSFIDIEHSKNEENEKKNALMEISSSIDSINEAFDALLKNITTVDTSDVMSDMAAMETMMKQDGLI